MNTEKHKCQKHQTYGDGTPKHCVFVVKRDISL